MDKKTALMGAALAALVAAAGCNKSGMKTASGDTAKGECHGVNACKGQGECGGPGHGCAGKNTCKGQGWVTKTASDCKTLGGTFSAK